jgi:hypothetical protein
MDRYVIKSLQDILDQYLIGKISKSSQHTFYINNSRSKFVKYPVEL